MAKRITEQDEYTGKVVTGKMPKGAKRTTLIPLTPAPQTRAQKFWRSAVG